MSFDGYSVDISKQELNYILSRTQVYKNSGKDLPERFKKKVNSLESSNYPFNGFSIAKGLKFMNRNWDMFGVEVDISW